MTRINSRQKGAAGEREAAAYLNSLGFTARRSVQNGVTDGRDIVVDDLPNVYFEVKRDQRVDLGTAALTDACSQAATKANGKGRWCVLWRKNNQGWRLTMEDERHGVVTVTGTTTIYSALKMLDKEGAVGC